MQFREESHLFAGALLVADVDLGGGVLADQHHGQPRRAFPCCGHLRDLFLDAFANIGGDRLPVQNLRTHYFYIHTRFEKKQVAHDTGKASKNHGSYGQIVIDLIRQPAYHSASLP